MNMTGKVALVTGGSTGIGEATCHHFAEVGAKVVVADISPQGERVVADLRSSGAEALFVRADVSVEADVAAMVAACIERFGRLDYAYNNAGIDQAERLTVAEIDESYWDKIIAINLKGVFLGMKHQIPAMLCNGGGAIVNASSGAGLKGVAKIPAYVASKWGVIGLTKSTAIDYASRNIRVNAVCPGPIETAMIKAIRDADPALLDAYRQMNPMERIGKPEDIARTVVWLCSDESSYTTGIAMSVDGGDSAA